MSNQLLVLHLFIFLKNIRENPFNLIISQQASTQNTGFVEFFHDIFISFFSLIDWLNYEHTPASLMSKSSSNMISSVPSSMYMLQMPWFCIRYKQTFRILGACLEGYSFLILFFKYTHTVIIWQLVWTDTNTTRSQMKWLWQYLQSEYLRKMLKLTLVNR